jgi:hypothetical protein
MAFAIMADATKVIAGGIAYLHTFDKAPVKLTQ